MSEVLFIDSKQSLESRLYCTVNDVLVLDSRRGLESGYTVSDILVLDSRLGLELRLYCTMTDVLVVALDESRNQDCTVL
jgi:hypothetical protein